MAKIVVNALIKNEERWAWFAINAVVDHVDEILVWDTGSTDKTLEIIKGIGNPKIKLREYGDVDSNSFTSAHNEMLQVTKGDWLIILDGDEIWPQKSIVDLVTTINREGDDIDYIISPYYNLIGDIYHYQESGGGKYNVRGHHGHISIRAINLKSIVGLHFDKPHGQLGIFDGQNRLIQDVDTYRAKYLDSPYLHATHLLRSWGLKTDRQTLKRGHKYKYELGLPFPKSFNFPAVLYYPRPPEVPEPWDKRSFRYWINAAWQTPFKWLKRRVIERGSGY